MDEKFEVSQEWYNPNGVLVKRYPHKFDYFFDFAAFLKGDLSGADLMMCAGLQNINDISGISLENARIPSAVCDKFDIQYGQYKMDNNRIESFSLTEENEKSTELARQTFRELDLWNDPGSFRLRMTIKKICYVSDIHLLHKLRKADPKSETDVVYVIKSVVDNIVKELEDLGNTILIGGDVASDFSIFGMFVKNLRSELDRRKRKPLVVFVLGILKTMYTKSRKRKFYLLKRRSCVIKSGLHELLFLADWHFLDIIRSLMLMLAFIGILLIGLQK